MLMLDLCCGLKGASAAMSARGWDVVTVDIDPAFEPDIVADVRTWQYDGPCPDLVWASPPCDEFAKFAMWCWYDVDALHQPDMSVMKGCKRIIDEVTPRFWVIENVQGATGFFEPVLGKPRIYRPYYLWGFFPPLGAFDRRWGKKTKSLSSRAKAARAAIPRALSEAVARVIEQQEVLL